LTGYAFPATAVKLAVCTVCHVKLVPPGIVTVTALVAAVAVTPVPTKLKLVTLDVSSEPSSETDIFVPVPAGPVGPVGPVGPTPNDRVIATTSTISPALAATARTIAVPEVAV
jgi:hypothetical protein